MNDVKEKIYIVSSLETVFHIFTKNIFIIITDESFELV